LTYPSAHAGSELLGVESQGSVGDLDYRRQQLRSFIWLFPFWCALSDSPFGEPETPGNVKPWESPQQIRGGHQGLVTTTGQGPHKRGVQSGFGAGTNTRDSNRMAVGDSCRLSSRASASKLRGVIFNRDETTIAALACRYGAVEVSVNWPASMGSSPANFATRLHPKWPFVTSSPITAASIRIRNGYGR
jgi:hypothetical protein